MRFLYPQIGWWLAAVVAAAALLSWRFRRRYVAATTVRRLAAGTYRASLVRRLPILLLVAALALTGAAMMEPVIPYSQTEVQSRGLDIVVVLDLSSSMEEDVVPYKPGRKFSGRTRLDATRDAIRTFVRGRRDDRVGLVVFSDHAYVVSPLTFDHEYLTHYIDMADDRILQGEGQTAIGDGLALANYLLFRQSRGDRANQVIVLFTDGENNRGSDPIEVLKQSHDANIRVHMVGVQLEDDVKAKPEVRALVARIKAYGGRYYDAQDEHDLQAASRDLDTIEKGVLVNKAYVRDAPVYQWFAVPALVVLALALGLRAVPWFVDLT
jgi:Ca-activated chloride channel family protein